MENALQSILEQAKTLFTTFKPNDKVFLIHKNTLKTGILRDFSIQIKKGLCNEAMYIDIINLSFEVEVITKDKDKTIIEHTSHVAHTKAGLMELIDNTNLSTLQASQNADTKESQW